jgi:hypothetical protein
MGRSSHRWVGASVCIRTPEGVNLQHQAHASIEFGTEYTAPTRDSPLQSRFAGAVGSNNEGLKADAAEGPSPLAHSASAVADIGLANR